METVVLNIRRDKSLTGYAAPYRIFIDGREMTKVSSGEKVSLIIPKQKCILKISMVGNSIAFHEVKKEVALFPEHCKSGIINCYISTKMKLGGVVTFGLLRSIGEVATDIEYF